MKPIIIKNNKFLRSISLFMNIGGISLWPFIIIRSDYSIKKEEKLIRHETIHFYQTLELLVLPFYMIYFLEWFLKSIYYRSTYKGYKAISFEVEANKYEEDTSNLSNRKKYNWIQFIFKKNT